MQELEQRTQEAEKRAQCAEEKVKIDLNILFFMSSKRIGRYFLVTYCSFSSFLYEIPQYHSNVEETQSLNLRIRGNIDQI